MKNQTNFLKIYLVPLLIVFLFSKVKAESFDSALTVLLNQDQESELYSDLDKKYSNAKKLFDDGNYSKSLELTYKLLGSKDALISVKSYLLLGKIFEKSNDLKTALNYFRSSLSLLESIDRNKENISLGYEKIEAENLRHLGKIYGMERKIDSSLFFLNKLIKIESLDDDVLYFKANAYNNLSIISFKDKKYNESKVFLDKAIIIFDKMNKGNDLSMAYINLANIYEVTNKREKALETYFKALPYIEHKNDAKSLEYKEALYYNIAWTMYNLKDYKAYEYLEKSYDLKDSLINVGLRKELKKIERTHSIDLIRKEEESKRERLIKNNWFLGIGVALIFLLLLYITNLNKLKQKNLSLQLSEKELEQQKKVEKLKSDAQIKIINATIDGKEAERKMIAETLHDNVSALLSSANMHLLATQKQLVSGKASDELVKTKQIIFEASQKVRDLSHNLVSSILLKFGLEHALKDVAEKFSNSTIKIHTAITEVGRYDQEFEIKVFNITHEFINNVLKHSKATSAYIVMEEENNHLLIIVKDNGCGFDVNNTQSDGIGLNQIEARIDVMGGDFSIESPEQGGTKVTINVPVVRREKEEANLV